MAAFDCSELFGVQMFKWQTAAIKLIVAKFCHMRTGIIWIQKLPFPFLKANKNNWVSWCYEACFTMIASRQKRAPYTLLLNFMTSEQTTNKQTKTKNQENSKQIQQTCLPCFTPSQTCKTAFEKCSGKKLKAQTGLLMSRQTLLFSPVADTGLSSVLRLTPQSAKPPPPPPSHGPQ